MKNAEMFFVIPIIISNFNDNFSGGNSKIEEKNWRTQQWKNQNSGTIERMEDGARQIQRGNDEFTYRARK